MLRIYGVVIQVVREVRPMIEEIERRDPEARAADETSREQCGA